MKSYTIYEHTYNYKNGTKLSHCLYNGTIAKRAYDTFKSAVANAKRLKEQTRIDIKLKVLDGLNYSGSVYTNGFESRKGKRK